MNEIYKTNDGGTCQRCKLIYGHGYFLHAHASYSWANGPDFESLRSTPDITVSFICPTCLTDSEVAQMLMPVAVFVLESLFLNVPASEREASQVFQSAAQVHATLRYRMGLDYPSLTRERLLQMIP